MGNGATTSSAGSKTTLSFLPILVGAVAGIGTGVFFGDYAAVLRPIGQLYVLLLQVAVYPYLISSLLHGLGSMAPATAWKLFKVGWPFYVFLWAVTFGGLWLLSLGVPQPLSPTATPSGSSFSTNHLFEMLIPSDPFAALSRNYIPAVILFCIFYGIALQHVKEKQAMLSILDGIRQASLAFWSFVVRLVPLAVFALFADTAGTTQVRELRAIGLFLFLFFAGVGVLAFWIIPGCLRALTPLKFSEVLGSLRSALTIALVTTISASALPFIIEATRQLADKCGIHEENQGEIARTNISVAYPLGQLGNFFVYFFIIFAAYIFGKAISGTDAALLPFISLLSCFGSPTSSVSSVYFLGSSLNLPSSVDALYVELMTLLRYGQVAASVMGFAFLSFTVVLAYYGRLRVRWISLLVVLGVGAGGLFGAAFTARKIYEGQSVPNPYLAFSLDPAWTKGVTVAFGTAADKVALLPGETVMERIQRTGVMTVGYNPGIIPFCYRNSAGDLVGYDVAYAYQLARDMNVRLRFIPFAWPELETDLEHGDFDVAMAGIYMTEGRLVNVGVTAPYFQSPLAFFTPRARAKDFLTRASILGRPNLRLGVFNDPVLRPLLERTFPNAHIVTVQDYDTVPDFSKIDAAFWTLTQAEALAAAHPELVAVAPTDIGSPLVLAYLTPPRAEDFLRVINYRLELQRNSDFGRAQNAYWIERLPRPDTTPRWSIFHDVLGFPEAPVVLKKAG